MKRSEFEEFLTKQFEENLAQTKLEVEQKYRVTDLDFIRRRLERLGARCGRKGMEHNELFDLNKTLRKKKQTLRLRYYGDREACLTLKGPRLKNQFKKRVEIETPVHYEHMKRILEMLGYRVFSSYRKYREEYELTSGRVCLNHLSSHGWFVEIESTPKRIHSLARLLQLEPKHRENRSYRKLLKEPLAVCVV